MDRKDNFDDSNLVGDVKASILLGDDEQKEFNHKLESLMREYKVVKVDVAFDAIKLMNQ